MLVIFVQFLVHVGEKLVGLHENNWVHRDLKPANTIWLPSKNAWTLIDFGCASRVGTPAELSFSLWYAPPEIITAYKEGKHTLVAHPSADVWALGVRGCAAALLLAQSPSCYAADWPTAGSMRCCVKSVCSFDHVEFRIVILFMAQHDCQKSCSMHADLRMCDAASSAHKESITLKEELGKTN